MQKAAEMMVREGVPFRVAAAECDQPLKAEEAERIQRSKLFQQILTREGHRYYQELAGDPEATKVSAAGMMLHAIRHMLDTGQWKEAVQAIERLAKLQGWMGIEGNVNIFTGLSDKDYEAITRKLSGVEPEGSGSRRASKTSVN